MDGTEIYIDEHEQGTRTHCHDIQLNSRQVRTCETEGPFVFHLRPSISHADLVR